MWPSILDCLADVDDVDEIDDAELVTSCEHDFLASVGCQDFDLTERQEDKLCEIEDLVTERRERLRELIEQRHGRMAG